MRKLLVIGSLVAILGVPAFVLSKVTIANPAWLIGIKYPSAKRQIISINSPDLHLWSAVAGLLGIPMTDPDHYLRVEIADYPEPLKIDDFRQADELYLRRCRVADISGYSQPRTRLSGLVFIDCDLSLLPNEQKRVIKKYSDKIPKSFYVPYEYKKKAEQADAANPHAFGTSGISAAEQPRMPEASGDT